MERRKGAIGEQRKFAFLMSNREQSAEQLVQVQQMCWMAEVHGANEEALPALASCMAAPITAGCRGGGGRDGLLAAAHWSAGPAADDTLQ